MAARLVTKSRKATEYFLRRPQYQQTKDIGRNEIHTKSPQSVVKLAQDECGSTASSKVNFSSLGYAIPTAKLPEINEYMALWSSSVNNWTLSNETTFAHQPEKIVLLSDNAMVISHADNSEVFYRSDGFNYSLPSIPSGLRGAARLLGEGEDGLVLCGKRELSFYNSNCEYVTSSKLLSGCPHTMTVDKSGNIILGMMDTKTIAIYNRNGSFESLFHTDSSPLSLAVTSRGQLAASFVDGTLQLIDFRHQSHKAISTRFIRPPSLVLQQWQPTGVCCSDNGDLFVVDWGQGVVYRYTADGEYLECVSEGLRDPQDVAVSPNGDELYVLESGLSSSVRRPSKGPCVKTFSLAK